MEELWQHTSDLTLWTASLFPVVSFDDHERNPLSLYWWLNDFLLNDQTIQQWRQSSRLSMAEILQQADAMHVLLWQRCMCTITREHRNSDYRNIAFAVCRRIHCTLSTFLIYSDEDAIMQWIFVSCILVLCGATKAQLLSEYGREDVFQQSPIRFYDDVMQLMEVMQRNSEHALCFILQICGVGGNFNVMQCLSRCMSAISVNYYGRLFLLLSILERRQLLHIDE